MINFTVGPVQSSKAVRKIGAEQVPYFRTQEFSDVMLENERLIKEFANASDDSKVVFLTGSGTASMEATVMNTLSKEDRVLIVNGGSFGQRFVDICQIHEIPHDIIKLEAGKALKQKHLEKYENAGITAFLVNVHETSTGVHYDMELISEFCKRNNIFLIVDAISSFLADNFEMSKWNVDVMITGSQKALACPPGISIIVLSQRAVEKVYSSKVKTLYFSLKSALENAKRGQTPFTPAVGILLQINQRLKEIEQSGGQVSEQEKIEKQARDFRDRIKDFPFEIVSESLSNAVTPLRALTASAYDIFLILKDEYGIWVTPNGGELREKVFRVGHIGELTVDDNTKLIEAFEDLKARNII
ncbi:pyridoxal-phosphate-dependent aminotransferase family protein [Helcococcus ovis]